LATLMMTGTPAAVCVLPQVAPAPAADDAGEHPVTRQAQPQRAPSPPKRVRRTPSRSTVSP
jgi:hypothetical protein